MRDAELVERRASAYEAVASVERDGASLSVELAERLIADADKAGLALDDLEPELGQPEVLIREALESDEGSPEE